MAFCSGHQKYVREYMCSAMFVKRTGANEGSMSQLSGESCQNAPSYGGFGEKRFLGCQSPCLAGRKEEKGGGGRKPRLEVQSSRGSSYYEMAKRVVQNTSSPILCIVSEVKKRAKRNCANYSSANQLTTDFDCTRCLVEEQLKINPLFLGGGGSLSLRPSTSRTSKKKK